MKIAIVGAGFTGLTAAYKLTQKNHHVEIFEKDSFVGGLASAFGQPGWDWSLERHYHHWFTNDSSAINLIKELGLSNDLLFPKTITSIYYNGKIYPFNSPKDVLTFSPLPLSDRLRVGWVTLKLKLTQLKKGTELEKHTAFAWLTKHYGKKAFSVLWEPLLRGKFGPFAQYVNMAWFWARIYKRTPRLGYLIGGYDHLLKNLVESIKKQGGIIHLNTPFNQKLAQAYEKVIVTTPSNAFTHLYPQLPHDYKMKLTNIPHLSALNLVLITKEKILPEIYWLNINDRTFPFLAIVAQTNLIDAKHYGGNHVTWIGNYLPDSHPFLKLSKIQLIQKFLPYIQKISPTFHFEQRTSSSQLFYGPFAQPVFPCNYSEIKPTFETPIPNVYLANMDMVYPWDRGTNYAIEMGEQIANHVMQFV